MDSGILSGIREATSNHGYAGTDKGYDKQGGVSIYLPDLKFRDIDKTLGEKTGLAEAARILDNLAKLARSERGAATDPTRALAADCAVKYGKPDSMGTALSPEQSKLAAPLTAALAKLKSDTTAEDRERDLETAAQAAHALLKSPLQAPLVAQSDRAKARQTQATARDLELGSDSPEWDQFVMALSWN